MFLKARGNHRKFTMFLSLVTKQSVPQEGSKLYPCLSLHSQKTPQTCQKLSILPACCNLSTTSCNKLVNFVKLQQAGYNIHLMCAPEGNSEFYFPESLNETRGKTKLTISRGSTHLVLCYIARKEKSRTLIR